MTEELDPFTLELRALVKKYHPDNLGHEIRIDIPKGNRSVQDGWLKS